MSKSRTLASVIALAILFTIGGMSVYSASKVNQSKAPHARNTAKIQKLINKNKGQKGQDYGAESTAAVEGIGKGGIKVSDAEKFKKMNKESKDKLYKESSEVKK